MPTVTATVGRSLQSNRVKLRAAKTKRLDANEFTMVASASGSQPSPENKSLMGELPVIPESPNLLATSRER